MPRLIDHAERDREIGDAAWRVLAREGVAGLSVRKVADEAGLATASLRRAFPTQAALRSFCLDRIQQVVGDRIRAHSGEGLPLVRAVLREVLPLDETRRAEMIVQMQLGSLALTDASLQDSVRQLSDGVRRVCVLALDELARSGAARAMTDAEAEADRLHALLDGLALQLLWSREPDEAARVAAVLDRHLATLDG